MVYKCKTKKKLSGLLILSVHFLNRLVNCADFIILFVLFCHFMFSFFFWLIFILLVNLCNDGMYMQRCISLVVINVHVQK